jgi:hypothetical protein
MHSESQWRYRASRRGLRLVKYKQDSTAYQQYGPYALVDRTTNRMVFTRLDAQAVERELFSGAGEQPADATGGC